MTKESDRPGEKKTGRGQAKGNQRVAGKRDNAEKKSVEKE